MKRTKEKIKLIAPSPEMKHRIMDFRAAFLDRGEKINGSCGLHHYAHFDDWMKAIRYTKAVAEKSTESPTEAPTEAPRDRLPSTTYLAIRLPDGAIVGIANIRHYLTEDQYHNGHIGCSVHPEERHKGYGTEILRLALIKAEQLGIIETVVTCNKGNIASKRAIERNGLHFEKTFVEDNGNIVLIYRLQH